MEQRPLSLPEFIGPLSLTSSTMDDQYDDFKVNICASDLVCRNLRTTSPETVSVVPRSRLHFVEKTATTIPRRRKEKGKKRESDHKLQAPWHTRTSLDQQAPTSLAYSGWRWWNCCALAVGLVLSFPCKSTDLNTNLLEYLIKLQ